MNDRLIQLIALAVLVAGLVATLMLTPNINRQRIDRQLTYDTAAGDAGNPQYALLASTGSFRGIMVNILWYRIEELKNDGKFAEANTLARTIVSLQPRFPGAWEFMAWNMAYNISVQCNTQEERWYWVNNGLTLLRQEGIPNNPRSIKLYRQLSWILSHKMGGRTDDMHWYYKRQFAQEWEEVLSAPLTQREQRLEPGQQPLPPNQWHELLPDQFIWQAVGQFRDISNMAQAYFRMDQAPEEGWDPGHYHTALSPAMRRQFFDDFPGLEGMVGRLEQVRGPAGEDLGLGLNTKTLRAFGYVTMLQRAGYNLADPALRTREGMSLEAQAILDFMREANANPEPSAERPTLYFNVAPRDGAIGRDAIEPDPTVLDIDPLLDLLRAQALIAEYQMDPAYMLWLMEEYGPLDWRHVNSHAVYWSALGTLKARESIDRSRIDFINNNRQTLHAYQGLAYSGTLAFRPRVEALGEQGEGVILTMVDPRFFPAYELSLERTRELIASGELGDVKADTYDTGHENFLHSAVMYSYYGGQTGLARYYFRKLLDEYGGEGSTSAYAADYEVYKNDMPGFAYSRLIDDDLYDSKVGYLTQLCSSAWLEGLIQRDPNVTFRYLQAAEQFYQKIEEDYQGSSNAGVDTQDRMDLPPFEVVLVQTFVPVITDATFSLQERASMWGVAAQLMPDLQTLYEVYSQMVGPLTTQLQLEGREGHVSEYFPMPQGFPEWIQEQQRRNEERQGGTTGPGILRQ